MNIKLFAIFFALFILTLPVSNKIKAEDKPIGVFVDYSQINLAENPINENGTTLVQFRPLFEALGLNITWDAVSQTVSGDKAGLNIQLTIGSKIAKINGQDQTLDAEPKIVNGNTIIPLRFVGESTGNIVYWNEEYNDIHIFTDNAHYLDRLIYVQDYQSMEQLLSLKQIDLNKNYPEVGGFFLHIATLHGSLESVELLLKYGAEVNLKDDKGQTALDIARENNLTDIIALLAKDSSIDSPKDPYNLVPWNSSRETVKQSETHVLSSEDDQNYLYYNDTSYEGNTSSTVYTFEDDKLISFSYNLSDDITDKINTFNDLEYTMTQKYGKPQEITPYHWVDGNSSDAYTKAYGSSIHEMLIAAITSGDLYFEKTWKTNDSTIHLHLAQPLDTLDLSVLYEPNQS